MQYNNQKIILNGVTADAGAPVIPAANRGFRYGDGCFETMRVHNGAIMLEGLHFKRLFTSLRSLGFAMPPGFEAGLLAGEVLRLCNINGHNKSARVRLTVFRGDGGLHDADDQPGYIIESFPLDVQHTGFNEKGLVAGVYEHAKKAIDHFSHIKSISFLPYAMAARWARENELDDALVLNTHGRVADASIANVFVVNAEGLKTPALSEGCIAGVMRQYILDRCMEAGIPVEETGLAVNDIYGAQEVFLTNAIRGIRWVQSIGNTSYTGDFAASLYNSFLKPLFR